MCVGWSLGFLSCSIYVYFSFCASTILSWLLYLCSIVWSQGTWFLQLHFSFSRLLWLFGVFCVSIQIVKFFVLVLWKMPVVVWQGLHWICRLLWATLTLTLTLTIWWFCGDENVLKLTAVMSAHICDYTKNHGIVHFKWVNYMACELSEDV